MSDRNHLRLIVCTEVQQGTNTPPAGGTTCNDAGYMHGLRRPSRLRLLGVEPFGNLQEAAVLNVRRSSCGLERGALRDARLLGDRPHGDAGSLDLGSDDGRSDECAGHGSELPDNYAVGKSELHNDAVAASDHAALSPCMDREALLRRLTAVAEANGLGLTSWPKKAGLSESIIKNMEKSKGAQLLTLATLQSLADKVNLTLAQLLDPNGPLTAKEAASAPAAAIASLTEELRLMREAQAEQTRVLTKILETLSEPPKQPKSIRR